jgi:sialate O-acetylesterase
LPITVRLAVLLLAISGFASSILRAEVRLPKLFSDHAVLQRQRPLRVWGWAAPGERVAVSFHGQRQSTAADLLGKWSVALAPEEAGGPYQLVVQGTNTVTVSDLLVGDVWLAAGQSNMEFGLFGSTGWPALREGGLDNPRLRLLREPHRVSDYPLPDQDSVWSVCSRQEAEQFSAVAYYFAAELERREQVPIGVIEAAWGATPIEAWTSLDGLSADPALMPVFQAWSKDAKIVADMPAILAQEKLGNNARLTEHSWTSFDPLSWAPAALFNGMIAPLVGYPIRGVIWYQGESNARWSRAPLYATVFPAMIADWRRQWGEGDFPFLYAQISSFAASRFEVWGIVRDAQRRSLALPNTAMAVTLDVGDPGQIHPPDKFSVGHRLALTARALAYGERVEDSGPLFRKAVPEGGGFRVFFDHGQGLTAKGGEPQGFELAGADHRFSPATAKIDGATVVVTGSVARPMHVRYAWANAPAANLYNGAGLPASTFSSESAAEAGAIRP